MSYLKLKELLEEKKYSILVFTHHDGDGFTSGYVFAKLLEKFGYDYKTDFDVKIMTNYDLKELENNFDFTAKLNTNYNLFVFLDVSLTDYSLLQGKIVVIDHHKTSRPNVDIFINPALNNDVYPNVSAIVYDFYHYCFGENLFLKRIAFIGSLTDVAVYNSLKELHIDISDHVFFRNKQIIFEYYLAGMLYALPVESKDKLFEEIMNFKDFSDFVYWHDNYLKLYYKELKKISEFIMKNKDTMEIINNVLFYELKEKYKGMQHSLVNALMFIYPNYDIFLAVKIKDYYKISIRSKTNVDLVDLINDIKNKFSYVSGGGHRVAAGMIVNGNYDLIKEYIIKNISKFRQI